MIGKKLQSKLIALSQFMIIASKNTTASKFILDKFRGGKSTLNNDLPFKNRGEL